jgi:hypothetical protein
MIADSVIEAAIFAAQAASLPSQMLAARRPDVAAQLSGLQVGRCNIPWTDAEQEYLVAHRMDMSDAEIAAALGRTEQGVHLYSERIARLPRPSKHPDYITATQAAKLLGVDAHKTISWFDRDFFTGGFLMPGKRKIRLIPRLSLYRWCLNPANWIWFDIDKVTEPALRRKLALARQRWGDEWWDTSQVAAYHAVDNKDVLRYIKHGNIRAVQASGLGGRADRPGWAHWFVLRSEATRPGLRFYKAPHYPPKLDWSPRADGFFLLAKAVGLPPAEISGLSGVPDKQIYYRLRWLLDTGQAVGVIRRLGLPVEYKEPGLVWADWRSVQDRFPRLLRAVENFRAHLAGDLDYRTTGREALYELRLVRGLLASWAVWFAPPERLEFAGAIVHCHVTPAYLHSVYQELCSWGLDPL